MFVGDQFCPSSNLFEVPYGHGRNAPGSTLEAPSLAHPPLPLALREGSATSDVSVSAQSQCGYRLHGFNGTTYGEGYLVVFKGEQVSVLEVEDQWARVQCHGSQAARGWVPTNYVQRLSQQEV